MAIGIIPITDLPGQQVYNLLENNVGSHFVKLVDLSMLAHGVYLVSVDADGQHTVHRVVKSK